MGHMGRIGRMNRTIRELEITEIPLKGCRVQGVQGAPDTLLDTLYYKIFCESVLTPALTVFWQSPTPLTLMGVSSHQIFCVFRG